jgi:hypothetical protein
MKELSIYSYQKAREEILYILAIQQKVLLVFLRQADRQYGKDYSWLELIVRNKKAKM